MTRLALAIAILASSPAFADTHCAQVLAALGSRLAEATCFDSVDLTTNNPATTPPNNSLAGQKPFAFTPITDRSVIAPALAGNRTPIPVGKAVPGIQINARVVGAPDDNQPRFLLRLPDDWNGRLVVAGASGTRSEFNGDFAWSDYVLQKGYAYASQNKGVLNLTLTTAADPLGCRLNPNSPVFVHFFDNDPNKPFTDWQDRIVEAAHLARVGVEARYQRSPRRTYAVGTSNGGYQVRRAVETAPQLFDGGVDWEGTFVDSGAPNLLTDLPPAILNFPDYVASGFDPNSLAAKNIRAAGYPPDLPRPDAKAGQLAPQSLWERNFNEFWEVTQCQWQKRLDPDYDTYVSGTGTYNYVARLSVSKKLGSNLAAFATTGRIRRPLITVAGTMDTLLPIDHHARAYARKVAAAQAGRDDDDGDDRDGERPPAYRLYEVQNGNHIDSYTDNVAANTPPAFTQLERIEPHAQRAFDLLVDHVERGVPLPPDQCIARGSAIASRPAQAGHCASLLAP
jgi:hypothetical protein